MASGDGGIRRVEGVLAFVAGAVIGSEVARRSGDRARSALDEMHWRADRLRDRAEELLDRVGEEGIAAATPRLGAFVREGGDAIRERVGVARERTEAVRNRAVELRDRASRALDRADAAFDRLDDAVARVRLDVRRRRRARPRRGPTARSSARVPVGVATDPLPSVTPEPPSVVSAMRAVAGTLDVDDPIGDAAKRLLDADDAYLVALDGDRIAGVVTRRHLLTAVAERLDPTTAAIADVMTAAITWIPPAATLDEAAVLVKYLHVDELVVAEDGRPVGVLRAGDVPR